MQNFTRIFFVLAVASACGLSGCLAFSDAQGNQTSAAMLPGNGVTIYAAGDIAQCKDKKPEDSGAAKTAALIVAGIAADTRSAVLNLGDSTYPSGLPAEFTDCYQPTWGQFKSRTFPAPGNHEYYTTAATGYYGYFGAIAGPERHGYYSVDIGTWHVVSLNSNLQPQANGAQLAWLENDLAQHPALCTLAYWHHPVYSSGGHGNNDNMRAAWNMLYKAGADVVLAGHDHDYERFAPQDGDGRRDDVRGIREFVVGTGGAKLTPLGLHKANSEVLNNTNIGVLKMVLKETGYEWQFIAADGSFSDHGSGRCH